MDCHGLIEAAHANLPAIVERVASGVVAVDEPALRCLQRTPSVPLELTTAVRSRLTREWIDSTGPAGKEAFKLPMADLVDPAEEVATTIARAVAEEQPGVHRYAISVSPARGLDAGWFKAPPVASVLQTRLQGLALGDPSLLGDDALRFAADPADEDLRARLRERGVDRVILVSASGSVPVHVGWRRVSLSGERDATGSLDFLLIPSNGLPPPPTLRQRLVSPVTLGASVAVGVGVGGLVMAGSLYGATGEHNDAYYDSAQALGWASVGLVGVGLSVGIARVAGQWPVSVGPGVVTFVLP